MSISNLEDNSASEFWLPQGGQLISILSSYNIKDFDLYSLLKKKGMLVGERDRKQMIMLLASTLITPADFIYLAKRISDREDKYRTIEASIQANEDADVISDIITKEYIDRLMGASSDKYPTFSIRDIEYESHSDGKVSVIGKVETHDWVRSLQATSKLHDFSFEVEYTGNSVRYISGTTTLETKKLIRYIRDEVNKTLKTNGVVNRRSKIFILRNNYFNNQISMFEFFRKFESNEYSCLKFIKTIDIIFNIHELARVPKEFKWMKEKINEISLKGDNIESNDVVKLGEKVAWILGKLSLNSVLQ
ncbi:hypothetical protein [Hymenobacter sp. DG01]|uniref:hypothetical protein n=1 Tax=Hymenobacter sp. DG01 TaxID=2584940 RepID=UPI00111F3D64|nr:hypothetical protein [Hymenobacter sp. DG01]